jgi:hypothetical protein
MYVKPETTAQRLGRVSYQRKAVMGVLTQRLSGSGERRFPSGDAGQCTLYLLRYACEEHRLRQRVRRKQRLARGEPVPACQWRLCHEAGEVPSTVSFDLMDPVTLLGRDETSDLLLPLPWVSRRHARLRVHPWGVHIEDLGSLNGIYVNGQRMREATLTTGDRLALGDQVFAVEYIGPIEGKLLA